MKFNGTDIAELHANTPCMLGFKVLNASVVLFRFDSWEGFDWFVEWCETTNQRFHQDSQYHRVTVFGLSA